jgi:hypothetical protein
MRVTLASTHVGPLAPLRPSSQPTEGIGGVSDTAGPISRKPHHAPAPVKLGYWDGHAADVTEAFEIRTGL